MAQKQGPKRVAKKLQALIKKRIKQLDLIDTGLMYESIEVTPIGDTYQFEITATDYFKYQDGYKNITQYVLDSDEFLDYVAEVLAEDIEISVAGDINELIEIQK